MVLLQACTYPQGLPPISRESQAPDLTIRTWRDPAQEMSSTSISIYTDTFLSSLRAPDPVVTGLSLLPCPSRLPGQSQTSLLALFPPHNIHTHSGAKSTNALVLTVQLAGLSPSPSLPDTMFAFSACLRLWDLYHRAEVIKAPLEDASHTER